MVIRISRCKLKKQLQIDLLRFFVAEVTARTAGDLVGVNHRTAMLFYHKIRETIASRLDVEARHILGGEIILERDFLFAKDWQESELLDNTTKLERQSIISGQQSALLIGIVRHPHGFFTKIDNFAKSNHILAHHEKIRPDSIVFSTEPVLKHKLNIARLHHHRFQSQSCTYESMQNDVNGVDNFWQQCKRRLHKYNGIPKDSFPLYIKECEFRFNFGAKRKQLQILRDWCFASA